MAEATLSTKNQIVIPREARTALNLQPGDKLLVVVRGERVIVLERPKSHHAAIRGIGRGVYSPSHIKKERRSW
jgi:AbrB family looped-hinge helix DNA binding protein